MGKRRPYACVINFVLIPTSGKVQPTGMSTKNLARPKIIVACDIGHRSIGWSACEMQNPWPKVLGCGTVIFDKEDIQTQKRAQLRRLRRQIAARRNRLKRMHQLFRAVGLEDGTPHALHPWPWFLAARVLQGRRVLTANEFVDTLVWYAHNRGYDGNEAWKRGEDVTKDDTERTENAKELMRLAGTSSMAETICHYLDVSTESDLQNRGPTLRKRIGAMSAAFPRKVVAAEVEIILARHIEILPGVDRDFIEALLKDWKALTVNGLRLPARYCGGLLFGQCIPRFDNRIIPLCPLTGQHTPLKHCRDYYRYRSAMLLKNLRVDEGLSGVRPLLPDERKEVWELWERVGRFTKTSLKQAVRDRVGLSLVNADTYFLTREMEDALVLDLVREWTGQEGPLASVFQALSPRLQKVLTHEAFDRGHFTLGEWRERLIADGASPALFDAEVARIKYKGKRGGQDTQTSRLEYPYRLSVKSGRAPYCRNLLRQAVQEVLQGGDPTATGGCLERKPETELAIALRSIRGEPTLPALSTESQIEKLLAVSTNNALVRHRLLILTRLLKDIVQDYAEGDASRIDMLVIEVTRDIGQFSGKDAKATKRILSEQTCQHAAVLKKLREELGIERPSGKLIRKARIAFDLGFTCPYTQKPYNWADLISDRLELDHLIPYSKRPSDSLESLVLTFGEINREKKNRTAFEFVESCAGHQYGQFQITTPKRYQEWVEGLQVVKPYGDDDLRRLKRRKALLLTKHYDQKERSFTGRDLTQTSHLNKLAGKVVRLMGLATLPISLPGQVTARVRRAWHLLGTLAAVAPHLADDEGKPLIKTEYRELTHLHHALDATAQAFAAAFFGRRGDLWRALLERRPNPDQIALLQTTGLGATTAEGGWELLGVPEEIKGQLVKCLQERRVVQHVSRRMSGSQIQETTWGIVRETEEGKIKLRQRTRSPEGVKLPDKESLESPTKLLGWGHPEGKLGRQQGVRVIEANWGLLLDPVPKVVPWLQVREEIERARLAYGKPVRWLRNGELIRVGAGTYQGIWRVHSIKDNEQGIALDMAEPDVCKLVNKQPFAKINARLSTILKSGLEVLRPRMTGTLK